ncbi:MAG: hypothetical protein P4M09_06955 [Devosia sp.]|nr:hypothetical protein [Devosia sp.]
MLAEQLRKDWRGRPLRQRLHERPSFVGAGLLLGADTVLAKVADLDAVESQARLRALLQVAYGRPPTPETLGHLKAAAMRWNTGDARQASLHLALSRLGRLDPPIESARRLFMADGLMRAGISPAQILAALDPARSADEAVWKYNPDQPRVPAGSGRPSGRWTSGGGTAGAAPASAARPRVGAIPAPIGWTPPRRGASTRPAPQRPAGLAVTAGSVDLGGLGGGLDLAVLTATSLARLAAFITALGEAGALGASILAGGVAVAVGIVVWSDTGSKAKWVTVGGPGNVSFLAPPDETAIRFRYTDANGLEQEFVASPDPGGNYRDPNGNPIARWVKLGTKIALVVNLAAFAGPDKGQPRLCPAETPDRPGARPKDQDFEDFMKAQVNPENPTPRGMAFQFYNPNTGGMVNIDDCQQRTGIAFEYKGTGFSGKVNQNNPFGRNMLAKLIKQAKAQEQSTNGRQLVWIFAEKDAADYIRGRFDNDNDLAGKIMVLDNSEYEKLKWES